MVKKQGEENSKKTKIVIVLAYHSFKFDQRMVDRLSEHFILSFYLLREVSLVSTTE